MPNTPHSSRGPSRSVEHGSAEDSEGIGGARRASGLPAGAFPHRRGGSRRSRRRRTALLSRGTDAAGGALPRSGRGHGRLRARRDLDRDRRAARRDDHQRDRVPGRRAALVRHDERQARPPRARRHVRLRRRPPAPGSCSTTSPSSPAATSASPSGNNGNVWRTTDGGDTWSKAALPATNEQRRLLGRPRGRARRRSTTPTASRSPRGPRLRHGQPRQHRCKSINAGASWSEVNKEANDDDNGKACRVDATRDHRRRVRHPRARGFFVSQYFGEVFDRRTTR